MTDDKPLILVTNDDGIVSEGIRAVATNLARDYDVIVAAPATDMSGAGTGIGRFDAEAGVETDTRRPRTVFPVPTASTVPRVSP